MTHVVIRRRTTCAVLLKCSFVVCSDLSLLDFSVVVAPWRPLFSTELYVRLASPSSYSCSWSQCSSFVSPYLFFQYALVVLFHFGSALISSSSACIQDISIFFFLFVLRLFTGSSGDLFEAMQLVKVGGDLDSSDNIVNYFHGIIAGLSVLFFNQSITQYCICNSP